MASIRSEFPVGANIQEKGKPREEEGQLGEMREQPEPKALGEPILLMLMQTRTSVVLLVQVFFGDAFQGCSVVVEDSLDPLVVQDASQVGGAVLVLVILQGFILAGKGLWGVGHGGKLVVPLAGARAAVLHNAKVKQTKGRGSECVCVCVRKCVRERARVWESCVVAIFLWVD